MRGQAPNGNAPNATAKRIAKAVSNAQNGGARKQKGKQQQQQQQRGPRKAGGAPNGAAKGPKGPRPRPGPKAGAGAALSPAAAVNPPSLKITIEYAALLFTNQSTSFILL